MKTTDAQKKATLNYRKKAITRISLDFKTELTEKVKEQAKRKNMSVQGYIKNLIDNDIEKDVE